MTEYTFVYEPQVYLISRPQMIFNSISQPLPIPDLSDFYKANRITFPVADESSAHVATSASGEMLCENAGRVCYMSFNNPRPGGSAAYFDRIKEEGHGSVFEHANYTFIFDHVSRSFTHELVRHRAGWGYSQLSQRFVDESARAVFVCPHDVKGDEQALAYWQESCISTMRAYREQVEMLTNIYGTGPKFRKRVRSAARAILPNCTGTTIQATANVRAIRHFIEKRADPAAEIEIRKVALRMLGIMKIECPYLFNDYTLHETEDRVGAASTKYPKV